jgi:ferrous iron transport protein A
MYEAIMNLLPIRSNATKTKKKNIHPKTVENLSEAETNKEYTIKDIMTDDKNITDFLFTLGCFKGESVTLLSVLSENYVITIKDARYSIDADLAKAVILN